MNNKDFERFAELLEGSEGCDFKEKIEGNPESITWKCNSDYKYCNLILDKYFPNEDKDKFLEMCRSKGGHCDCEILFNVENAK